MILLKLMLKISFFRMHKQGNGEKGFTTSTDKGTPIVTPELIAFNSLTKNIIGLAKVLGIGSPNRARLI